RVILAHVAPSAKETRKSSGTGARTQRTARDKLKLTVWLGACAPAVSAGAGSPPRLTVPWHTDAWKPAHWRPLTQGKANRLAWRLGVGVCGDAICQRPGQPRPPRVRLQAGTEPFPRLLHFVRRGLLLPVDPDGDVPDVLPG